MATKLKKMRLTSVDLVRAGANQKADICLYKSANTGQIDNQRKDGSNMIKIDKSLFTPEELEQYEALIAKASVDPEIGEEEMEKEKPPFPPRREETEKADDDFDDEEDFELDKKRGCKKSADDYEREALFKSVIDRQEARIADLEKSLAMKGFTEIAKKYAVLGENPEELAKTLYDMSQADGDLYNRYVDSLEKSLDLVEKSGMFAEIGKSRFQAGASTTVGKVEAIAKSYMENDAALTYDSALAKAWENNPDLVAEYDMEYKA